MAQALALLDNDNKSDLDYDAMCVAAKFPVADITALMNSVDDSRNDNDSKVLDNIEAEPVVVVTADTDASGVANFG